MSKKERLQIIEQYLATHGGVLRVEEFLEWVKGQPGTAIYEHFFGQSDAEAAHNYRKNMVRQFISDLRITVRMEEPRRVSMAGFTVQVYEVPRMIPPSRLRHSGGGYVNVNLDDPEHRADLSRQASSALMGWISRYEGVAVVLGIDVEGVRATMNAFEGAVPSASAAE
jgi:hypothetical protein